jgi:hypothetical protein
MKNISTICLTISIAFLPWVGVADGRARIAKYALKGYIHPIDAIFVREKIGNSNTAYKWEGIYRWNPNNPKIKAELKSVGKNDEYGICYAAVSVYEQQLKSLGIDEIQSLGSGGLFSYMIRDRQGKQWQVMVSCGSIHEEARKSTKFSASISTPGG